MTLRDPYEFRDDLDALEAVERAALRMVAHSMCQVFELACDEFRSVISGGSGSNPAPQGSITDKTDYLGEDLTRMALDQIGVSKVPGARLFGAIDYKVAALMFMPDFAVEQALFVDSKAEKGAMNNCRVQLTQTSLEIRQMKGGHPLIKMGLVRPVWETLGHKYLTSTLFVKYHYTEDPRDSLKQITVAALPHGFLQQKYNPTVSDDIWNVGPDSPARKETFRTRLNFGKLQNKARWRVQRITHSDEWTFEE